jgi:hypothetical protein
MMNRILASFTLAVALFSWGAPAYAAEATFFGPLVSPECNCEVDGVVTAPDWGCVMQTIQNTINLTISLSIIIATLFILYTGFMFVASAGNPRTREQAKTRLMNVVVGIVVVLSAWLIVDFVMKTLYGEEGKFGPWNSILQSTESDDQCFKVSEAPSPLGPLPPMEGGGGVLVAGNTQQRICASARNYYRTSTAAGPSGGVLACAWAVNNVLRGANVRTVDGDSVQDMQSVLESGRGTRIESAGATCGDLVLVTGDTNHVGVCMNAGCSEVLSNSSSRKSFSWRSGPRFEPSYNNPNYKIYRVSN